MTPLTPTPTTATRTPVPTPTTPRTTLRTPALVGGIGLLLMAVLSGWANFGVVEVLVTDGDAARTARDVLAAQGAFRLGVAALFAAAFLDLVVAWALRAFFAPVHRGVSTAAAWFRVVYTGFFVVAIAQLARALDVLTDGPAGSAAGQVEVEALRRIESFHLIWDTGLGLFGLHLVLLGYLAYRSGYAPRALGVLLVIAGGGYVVDSLGAVLAPGSIPEVAVFTFVGEVLLFVWLLVRGRTVTTEDIRTGP